MGKLERGTPTSRHNRPELVAGFGMLFPERSQVLRAYFQDIDERRRRRAGEFEEELLDAARCPPEEIIERILNDERAGELFERGVQEAILTAEERKRRALARAVATGVLASDTAAIDEAQFLVHAITELEPSHVRILLVLERPNKSHGHQPGMEHAYTVAHLEEQTGASSEIVGLLLAKLASEGLAVDWTDTTMGITGEGIPCWAITGFGQRVLALLQSDGSS